MRFSTTGRVVLVALAVVLATPLVATGDPAQHGPNDGHLLGTGASGLLELLSVERVTNVDDLVADVAVSPDGQWAYLANWGEPDCAGPEKGGQTSPDAGAWVIDISDLSDPETVGFIPSHQDTRPGEGLQVVRISTRFFNGDMLVMNNELCGKNGKGGVSLFDVTDPRKPVRLSENFGDRGFADNNEIHSAFAWDAGDRAYVAMADNVESGGSDIDVLDITNPSRPRKIAEYALNAFAVSQTDLGLVSSFVHDLVVKQIGGRFIMLASYWDGGYVQLDVTEPATPVFLGDTDFNNPDPELLESTGVALPPEGNGHQAEYTLDDEMFVATDEDFAPYGATSFSITSGAFAGAYPSVPVPGSSPITILPDEVLDGPVVYGGYGCPASAPIPTPESIPGYLGQLGADEEKIVVLQRGPTGDPSATEGACFPGEKANMAVQAGWDAVVFVQRHGGTENPPFCGSGAFVDVVVGVCTNHEAFHKIFNTAPFSPPWTYPDGPAIGTIGADIRATARFDGWGYVHLYDRQTMAEIDTYAIDEAHQEQYAIGYGDLTVHEVATDPQNARRAYLSYYSGGMRMLEIQCTNPLNDLTCELVEVGSYLDERGNDFWGVEAFVRDGVTYVLGSDRDSGLWVFRARNP